MCHTDGQDHTEWLTNAVSSIKQFKVEPTSLSMMDQVNEYYLVYVPLDVRQSMCLTELNQCNNGGTCVADPARPVGFHCNCLAGYFSYTCDYSTYLRNNVSSIIINHHFCFYFRFSQAMHELDGTVLTLISLSTTCGLVPCPVPSQQDPHALSPSVSARLFPFNFKHYHHVYINRKLLRRSPTLTWDMA